MAKTPDNMKHLSNPTPETTGGPSGDRRRELKKLAKGGKLGKGAADQVPQQDIEGQRASLREMIHGAETEQDARELFETLGENLITEEQYSELRGGDANQTSPSLDMYKKPNNEAEQAEQLEKGTQQMEETMRREIEEEVMVPEVRNGEGSDATEQAEAPLPAEETIEGQPEEAAEIEEEEVENLPASEKAELIEKPVKKRSAFLGRVKQNLERSEQERSEQERPEREIEREIARKQQRGASAKKRLAKLRSGRNAESDTEELTDEERSLIETIEEEFQPSPELIQKFKESGMVWAEAELLWEKVRGQEFSYALIPILKAIAKRNIIAEGILRKAKEAEMAERRSFLEEQLSGVGAHREDREDKKIKDWENPPPTKITIEDLVKLDKSRQQHESTTKTGRERQVKLLRNIKNFIGELRYPAAGGNHGKKIELLWKISGSENIARALDAALEQKLIDKEDYEKILSDGKEDGATKIDSYMSGLDLRYASGEIGGEDWDRLRACAERVFASDSPAEEASLAYAGGEISEEEKEEILLRINTKGKAGATKAKQLIVGAEKETSGTEEKPKFKIRNSLVAEALKRLENSRMDPIELARLSITLDELGGSTNPFKDLKKMRGEGGINQKDYQKLQTMFREVEKGGQAAEGN